MRSETVAHLVSNRLEESAAADYRAKNPSFTTGPDDEVLEGAEMEDVADGSSTGQAEPRHVETWQSSSVLFPTRVWFSATSERPQDEFVSLQSWEGEVLSVEDDHFFARLVDLTGELDDQEAEIYRDEVDPGDLPLLHQGAIFYWRIGYLKRKGQRVRTSAIRFRRLPEWSEKEIEEAGKTAEQTRKLLGW